MKRSYKGIEFYSHSLRDAVYLARASMNEGSYTYDRVDFHIADISRYEGGEHAIKILKEFKKLAKNYDVQQARLHKNIVKGLSW